MIHAISWFCKDHYGILDDCRYHDSTWHKASPDLSDSDALLKLIGKSVKYLSRMPAQSRASLCAASVVLKATEYQGEIGLIAAGKEGCLQANQDYFQDYVAGGRTLGRGNLFIYTLTTSTLGEIAIALGLTGPSIYFDEDSNPLISLVAQAERLVAGQEAEAMLALWSEAEAAVCIAVGPQDQQGGEEAIVSLLREESKSSPKQLAARLGSMVQRA